MRACINALSHYRRDTRSHTNYRTIESHNTSETENINRTQKMEFKIKNFAN